jgi:hypothetical protein
MDDMITRQMMKHCSSLVTVVTIALLVVGCGAGSPTAPEPVSGSIAPLAATQTATSGAPVVARPAFFPPIEPPGISCPSDAPQIRVGSLGSRLDIEFSEIKGTIAYEIEIRDSAGQIARQLEIAAPAHHAEWNGPNGAYLVRVRSRNCGGFGNWSESAYQHIHDGVPPAPDCGRVQYEATQESFTFWWGSDLQTADVTIKVSNGDGIWGVALFSSPDDLASDTELERSTSGTYGGVNSTAHVKCGESTSLSVHEENHPHQYWWYRIYFNGGLYFTSARFSM